MSLAITEQLPWKPTQEVHPAELARDPDCRRDQQGPDAEGAPQDNESRGERTRKESQIRDQQNRDDYGDRTRLIRRM